jgi:hypothetical protein
MVPHVRHIINETLLRNCDCISVYLQLQTNVTYSFQLSGNSILFTVTSLKTNHPSYHIIKMYHIYFPEFCVCTKIMMNLYVCHMGLHKMT